MPMDLTGQRRADIEDERTGPAMELVNRLLATPRTAFHDLTTHPFQTPAQAYGQKYDEYLKANPPAYGSPLAQQLGEGDIWGSMFRPISFHPEGIAPPEEGILAKILRGEM